MTSSSSSWRLFSRVQRRMKGVTGRKMGGMRYKGSRKLLPVAGWLLQVGFLPYIAYSAALRALKRVNIGCDDRRYLASPLANSRTTPQHHQGTMALAEYFPLFKEK